MNNWSQILSPKQIEIANDIKEKHPRHVILEGAVRSGKTWLGAYYWNAIVSRTKGKTYIMTGHTISSLKRNVLDLLKDYDIDTHLNINNEFEMYENKIACFGTDKADSFKSMHGMTSAGWYGNEVTLSHQNSILEAFARCSELDSKIIWDTNPDRHTHYIKTDYINSSGCKFNDGSYNILSYHFNLEDNTYLDTTYIESLKQSIPIGTYYDRMILGLWKASDKAVYNNYDIVLYPPEDKYIDDYCYGLDFGWTNPSAFTKVMFVDGEIYIQGLFYLKQLSIENIIRLLNVAILDKTKPIYCDLDLDKISALRNSKFNAIEAKKGTGSVMAGINKVREYKLHIINTDTNLIHEIENYELKSNAQGEVLEEPIKFNDHYCDSFRYAIYTHNFRENNDSYISYESSNKEYKY